MRELDKEEKKFFYADGQEDDSSYLKDNGDFYANGATLDHFHEFCAEMVPPDRCTTCPFRATRPECYVYAQQKRERLVKNIVETH